MKGRGRWQGMMMIARLNWPFYLIALLVLGGSVAIFFSASKNGVKLASGIAIGGATYFLFVSLGVSHLVYDRSDLYRWKWLKRALAGVVAREVIFCHSGFDDCSADLRKKLGAASGRFSITTTNVA